MRCCSILTYGHLRRIVFYDRHKKVVSPEVSQSCSGLGVARDYERESLLRSKRTIRHLFLCNDWDYFVTLTLSPRVCDRHNLHTAKEAIAFALESFRRVNGDDFSYLLVPDYHKDGAIHFHGFFRCPKSFVKRAGNFYLKKRAYPKYYSSVLASFGRNEFRPLVPALRRFVLRYTLKYVDKTLDFVDSGARYLCSRGLCRCTSRELYEGDSACLLESCADDIFSCFCTDYGVRFHDFKFDEYSRLFLLYFETLSLGIPLGSIRDVKARKRIASVYQLSFALA